MDVESDALPGVVPWAGRNHSESCDVSVELPSARTDPSRSASFQSRLPVARASRTPAPGGDVNILLVINGVLETTRTERRAPPRPGVAVFDDADEEIVW